MKIVERDLFADFYGSDDDPEEVEETEATEETRHTEKVEPAASCPEGEDAVGYADAHEQEQVSPEYVVHEAMTMEEYEAMVKGTRAELSDANVAEPVVAPVADPEPVFTPKGSVGQLFRTFFKIGIVTFGGGYAMIPMIESEVVDKKQWVEREQFLDLIAVSQTCPGVFAINISTFIGYKLRRTRGALCAALGAALPSFLIILAIAMLFRQFQDVPWVAACFKGIRPAVVALIAVPTFNLAKSAKINLSNCWIPIVGALLICMFGVNPVFIILGAAFLGYLYGIFLNN